MEEICLFDMLPEEEAAKYKPIKSSDWKRGIQMMEFFKSLDNFKKNLTSQQYKTLKGQALAGDVEGAEKGLKKLRQRIQKVGENDEEEEDAKE